MMIVYANYKASQGDFPLSNETSDYKQRTSSTYVYFSSYKGNVETMVFKLAFASR